MIPVILSGGSGTGLWPLSRRLFPKQFLQFPGEHLTFFQNTVQRCRGFKNTSEPIIVCNEEHRFIVSQQLMEIHSEHPTILLEPFTRNTAPAITLAVLEAKKRAIGDEDPLLLILPSDHWITETTAFINSVQEGVSAAEDGKIVMFGVKPDSPETSYGYIETENGSEKEPVSVILFREKPSRQEALSWLESDSWFWNSGIYLFRASVYLEELQRFSPDILESCEAIFQTAYTDLHFTKFDADIFLSCPAGSVDYAIMEKTDRSVLVKLETGWSDIDSWDSFWNLMPKNPDNNVVYGDACTINTKNSLVFGTEKRLVVTVGIEDTAVIDTKDATLVVPLARVQEVKKLLKTWMPGTAMKLSPIK
ncbi:mannose-1-phosphate guanylyltransferase/mannose-6-phosphate isomerase [Brucepastera parasyntrophica]|uniref:mannose-1-phosphate guanylyltransferase/mannose-6-phosphate isomerase n=1 Tax=Brucepastera parasyntrophica TaxID=2880008 RepID=UPI00210CC26E|nr:mannose-1-phosphate guanylyltransferase/mannose-6-phosphate isomerase [Brucepastera parasyntrophica]ULQ59887.1 mannose-1-phosphate guanylyltransferase/mannose-6-phosphate isomerase [Brucepastera parasyntrophica]